MGDLSVVLAGTLSNQPGKITRKEHSHPATYALLHRSSGSAYVGSTGDLYKRLAQHNSDLCRGVHKNSNLQEAYDADPVFDLAFAKASSKEEALKLEQTLITEHYGSGKLLNLAPNAEKAALGLVHSDETKERLRQAAAAQFSTQEARDAQSERSRQLWQDPAFRAKHEGAPLDDSTKDKISGALKDLWSDPEYRAKMMAAHAGRGTPVTVKGVEYPSIAEASRLTGIPKSTIQTWKRGNKL